jgi:hypothetical protein
MNEGTHTFALILGLKDLKMAARHQHLSPAFLSGAVKLLEGDYEELPEIAENRANSYSSVITASPVDFPRSYHHA